jgi:AbiV family abortive infection protein
LSVLAMEETGKAYAAYMLQQFGDEPEVWDSFWAIVRHHTSKINAALFLERFLPRIAGLDPDEMAQALGAVAADDIYLKKLRGMYVDEESGEVIGPDAVASDEEARALAITLRKSVTIWSIIFKSGLEKALGIEPPRQEL